jgi:hypothetical protein
MRVQLLVETTYHPEAGGSRRWGEVFEVPDELGLHWIGQGLAEDATDAALTPPRLAQPNPVEPWPTLPPLDPTQGTVVNGAQKPVVARPRGLQKQGRR